MKPLFLYILLLLPFCGFSQTRPFKGNISTDIGHGCVVIAEPSGIWATFTWDYASREFYLKCPKTDTALTFIFSNKRLKYKIDPLRSDSIINIDSLYNNNIGQVPLQKNEYQIIINDVGLLGGETQSYLIDDFGIRVSRNWYYGADSMIEHDHYVYYKYQADTAFDTEIKNSIAAITKNVAEGEYEGNADDGQRLEIKVIFNEHYYSYMFHEYYVVEIGDLIETLNSIVEKEQRIYYSPEIYDDSKY